MEPWNIRGQTTNLNIGKYQPSIYWQYRRRQRNFDPQKFFIGLMEFFSILVMGEVARSGVVRL